MTLNDTKQDIKQDTKGHYMTVKDMKQNKNQDIKWDY